MARNKISAVVERDGDRIYVTHMDLAIYCHMLHRLGHAQLPILDVIRVTRGKHEFVFEDPNGVIREVELQFANGRDSCFAEAQRSLKSVMRDKYGAKHEGSSSRRTE